MPIYAYRCSACDHEQDVLQKMSDPVLTDCPSCGQSTYVKQVTAAGFQLKGTGWYETDFKNKNTSSVASAPKPSDSQSGAADSGGGSQAAATEA